MNGLTVDISRFLRDERRSECQDAVYEAGRGCGPGGLCDGGEWGGDEGHGGEVGEVQEAV